MSQEGERNLVEDTCEGSAEEGSPAGAVTSDASLTDW
jgi:hypothetical protein